jgi:uncharacterized protein (TIGR02118 family)
MTVKLVVLYTQPDDPGAFESHYLSVHMPLAHAMPGLLRAESGKFAGRDQPYYRAAELWFADQEALNAAASSPEGKATNADYAQIAPPGSQTLVQVLDD